MNLIEAIKSGRPFKRSSWDRDFVRPPFVNLNLPAQDLIADDWEVEQTSVTITRKDFDSAWSKIWPNDPQFDSERNLIAKELGL